MVFVKAGRLAVLLCPLLLVAACSSGDPAQRLGERLQLRLAPDIASGNATLEQFPNGSRVTLTEQSLFSSGGTELDDKGRYVLASVIEGLLAPRILQIEVVEAPWSPAWMQGARVQNVKQFFEDYGLGTTLQPVIPPQGLPPGQVGIPPQGMAIAITVVSG
jgi:hypothetical protein